MARKRRSVPPPTAHRFAAWLSLAQGLLRVRGDEVRFLPHIDDVRAIAQYWHQRLPLLRNAGVEVLRGEQAFKVAMECKPYAFWYCGEGQCCRRWFCPYCNAATAAETYERLRRVVDRNKPIGLVMNRNTTKETLSDLPAAISSYVTDKSFESYGEAGPMPGIQRLGSIIRCSVWPHEWKKDTAVLQPWCIHAVTDEYAQSVYDVFLKTRGARDEGRRRPGDNVSLTQEEEAIRQTEDSSVRCARFSLAKAAARICQYPEALLAADPGCAAKLINAIDSTRLSIVRGVFRSSLPINPKAYPLQFVPTNRNGKGIVPWVMRHTDRADEGSAAREFARALDLPPVDTFAAVSGALGLPLYWLGSVSVTMMDLASPPNQRNLSQAVVKCCPSVLAGPHAFVFACPGVGLAALSTWPPVPDDLTVAPAAVLDGNGLLVNVRVRKTDYTMETLGSFRYRWTRATKLA